MYVFEVDIPYIYVDSFHLSSSHWWSHLLAI